MTYAYCNKHQCSWDANTKLGCSYCADEDEMIASQYEPGDEPDDDDLCQHGTPRPCPACRFEAALDRYDVERKERREQW